MDINKGDYGYAGSILKVNLTDGSITTIPTSTYSDKFIGGRAMGAAIYWDEVPAECGALDPENSIIWTCGPACGVLGPGPSRVAVTTKAFSTIPEAYSTSVTGAGHWGAELRFAGYDGLIVMGKSATPVYLHITDDEVVIRPAERLWGMTTRDCDNEIKRLWGVSTRVAQIGPAGENLNANAIIMTDFSHATGNGGFGAVMGSKNLKAVAVHGMGGIKVKDPKQVIKLFHDKVLLEGPNPNSSITEAVVMPGSGHAMWPVDKDYVKSVVGEGESLEARWDPDSPLGQRVKMEEDVAAGEATYKFGGCWSCPGGCHFSARYNDINLPTTPMNLCHQAHVFKDQRLATKDKMWGRAEYLWSGLCCEYGMTVDIFGSHNTWVMDLMQAGVLSEEDFGLGYEWDAHDPNIWTNEQFIRDVIYNVCYRKGSDRFNSISDGPTKCLEWLSSIDDRAKAVYDKCVTMKRYYANDAAPMSNQGSPIHQIFGFTDFKYAHHATFMKMQGGSLHLNMMDTDEKKARLKQGCEYYSNRMFGEPDAWGYYKQPEENTFTGKALPIIFFQDTTMEMDSFSLCGWAGWPIYASAWSEDGIGSGGIGTELYNAIMGSDYYYEDQVSRWSVAWTLSRAIQVREGRRKEHDIDVTNNQQFVKAQMSKYPGSTEGFIAGIEEYYDARGWDPTTGIPRKSTLEAMGLGYVAQDLISKYGIDLMD